MVVYFSRRIYILRIYINRRRLYLDYSKSMKYVIDYKLIIILVESANRFLLSMLAQKPPASFFVTASFADLLKGRNSLKGIL